MKIIDVLFLASLERIRSFDRGSIELPRTLSNVNNHRMSWLKFLFFSSQSEIIFLLDRVYALYDYDGSMNNNNIKNFPNRLGDRHIKLNEGDELEIIEDDDEHVWRVKNLRTNEIGLIPATLVGTIDGEQKSSQRSLTTPVRIF